MFWVWLACAALVGIGGGVFLGFRGAMLLMQPGIMERNRNIAGDRNFALSVLRRELANWMFRRDPNRYRRAYMAAHEATAAIAVADRAEKRRQLAKLAEQYPFYTDFDLVGTRDCVLYADALGTNSYDDIERHYTDIIRFQALQAAIDENWPDTTATRDEELTHLDDYVRRFKDTMFKGRLEAAVREFHAYRHAKGDDLGPDQYETAVLAVRHVAHFAETRYGVHFKDTDEFGLYGVFFADGRDKPFTGFYRSNAGFSEETILDDMPINGPL
jgi:hypothetical protein